MSVLLFPVECRLSRPAAARATDRVEPVLIAALVLTTAAQIGLFVWSWLA
ncbi:hypothetical protein ACETK8_07570 [Brevundimonas staleyi]|uniref:Uncharacterized protein n=1 Tax=Brevundimonas staleyi TaxID=74326 RepID=A0ABW0FRJ6_9CAUL